VHDALDGRQFAATVLNHEIPQRQADLQGKQQRDDDRPRPFEGQMRDTQEEDPVETRAQGMDGEFQPRTVAIGQGDGEFVVIQGIQRTEDGLGDQQGNGPVQR
jgi:hypothetical protein